MQVQGQLEVCDLDECDFFQVKIEDYEIQPFEYWLNQQLEVIKLVIIPDTNELYESDEYFRNIVKNVKKAQKIRDEYINKNNK